MRSIHISFTDTSHKEVVVPVDSIVLEELGTDYDKGYYVQCITDKTVNWSITYAEFERLKKELCGTNF